MEQYFSGEKLYGDDFTIEQIEKWYKEESEAYSNLGSKDFENYNYGYHVLNTKYGFNKIKHGNFNSVLGIGAAWGHELEPVIDKVKQVTILEPSDLMKGNKIGEIKPVYVKPSVSGTMEFENNSFDLITCFGALHHVPNVSHVLSEMIRVLKPGGHILMREPIISMGDWRVNRSGLTKNERGIPVKIFDEIFHQHSMKVISKHYCFTATSFLQLKLSKYLKTPLHSNSLYLWFDKYVSLLLKNKVKYHATKMTERIAPGSVFYVVQKKPADN
ncbi:class I SAM-dependent methyltransferase [Labilibacter sediminis]|nr:class I SAM-dependent methyltransferase [Labilibacter sediminis]